MGAFAHLLGVRPWECELLTVWEFYHLTRWVDHHIEGVSGGSVGS